MCGADLMCEHDEPPAYAEECPECRGEGGWVESRPSWSDPYSTIEHACTECGGMGWVISDDPSKLPDVDDGFFEHVWC